MIAVIDIVNLSYIPECIRMWIKNFEDEYLRLGVLPNIIKYLGLITMQFLEREEQWF